MAELGEWESFYVIIGSAAAVLIGLQFVMMTLVAAGNVPRPREAGAAFATPTIIHFGTPFVIAALLRMPWHGIGPAAALWGVIGLAGLAYTGVVVRRMRSQTAYRPEGEDWLFHGALPFLAYGDLAICALVALSHVRGALFGVGAATLVLLCVGIHNAWDAVSYHVFGGLGDEAG